MTPACERFWNEIKRKKKMDIQDDSIESAPPPLSLSQSSTNKVTLLLFNFTSYIM